MDFVPEVKLITHIATQGNGKSWWWVKEYYVMYKKRQEALTEYMENNHRVVSKILLSSSFLDRSKEDWRGEICKVWEFYNG